MLCGDTSKATNKTHSDAKDDTVDLDLVAPRQIQHNNLISFKQMLHGSVKINKEKFVRMHICACACVLRHERMCQRKQRVSLYTVVS